MVPVTRLPQLVAGLGSLSREHGVGLEKRGFVEWEGSAPALALTHRLEAVFDRDGIPNPGKTRPAPRPADDAASST